jgi:hypothetical protein
LTAGTGFTVTITLSVLPGHPFAEEVTTYVAFPGIYAVLCNVCWMIFPEPAEKPVIPGELP